MCNTLSVSGLLTDIEGGVLVFNRILGYFLETGGPHFVLLASHTVGGNMSLHGASVVNDEYVISGVFSRITALRTSIQYSDAMKSPKEHGSLQLHTPATREQWQAYYQLRWLVLRAPWGQPPGSEKDELEASAVHIMASIGAGAASAAGFRPESADAVFDQRVAVAVGRLHVVEPGLGQIRYMAVAAEFQRQGLGQCVLELLEHRARQLQLSSIYLNAREPCVDFYLKLSYQFVGQAPTLYGSIKHRKMLKQL